MVFMQGSAPTGWSRTSSYDGRAIRISSSGGGTGGSRSWDNTFDYITKWHSNVLTGRVTDGHTLTASQGPVHNHSYDVPRGTTGGQYGFQDTGNSGSSGTQAVAGNTPGGGSHSHDLNNISLNIGTYVDRRLVYATAIICSKN